MHLTRHARRAVIVAATATFVLGASASLAYADTTTAPGQSVLNHGQCIANGNIAPGSDLGPLTINKNHLNVPNDGNRAYIGCSK